MKERLLGYLQGRANRQGLVRASESALSRRIGVSREDAEVALQGLSADGSIEVLAPLPFLVAKLHSWPGVSSNEAGSRVSAYSHPKQLFQQQQSKNSNRPLDHGTQGAGEGLLGEILETLGETDPASFRRAVELYSPHIIRIALNRVRRAQGIRKSRTALFRHLLPRLAREFPQAS